MTSSFLSHFTPSLMEPETLETIFVQREQIAERATNHIRESVLTGSKYHTLIIGPRGIGKTHLLSLIYHRIIKQHELVDLMVVAWLREEEWGVSSFLDLLLRVLRALPESVILPFQDRVQKLYSMSLELAEREAGDLLKEIVHGKTLVVLLENLDDLFEGLGDDGQKRFRAYLQNNPYWTIFATTPSLFRGISQQTSAFYGFFRPQHLKPFTSEDATSLLLKIAQLQSNEDLAAFLQTPSGRARVSAVHHLAGGNPRIFMIFAEFLSRESLNELVSPFLHMLDELTPYYQAKMKMLSPQQRKIVEYLSDVRHAAQVKEIAQRCFLSPQVTSNQLKELREKGYVKSIPIGREAYYELSEPLMRFCLEVKKQRGEPVALFVQFLRLWWSTPELERRLAAAISGTDDYRYLKRALTNGELESPTEGGEYANDKNQHTFTKLQSNKSYYKLSSDNLANSRAVEECRNGHDLLIRGQYKEALNCLNKAVKQDPTFALAWEDRGTALGKMGKVKEALSSYRKVLTLSPNNPRAFYNAGTAAGHLGLHKEALQYFTRATDLEPSNATYWLYKSTAAGHLGVFNEAASAAQRAAELEPTWVLAWEQYATALSSQSLFQEALAAYQHSLTLDPKNSRIYLSMGTLLRNMGQLDQSLQAFTRATELDPKSTMPWLYQGRLLHLLGRHEEALSSFETAIKLDSKNVDVIFNLARELGEVGKTLDAITILHNAVEERPHIAPLWDQMGVHLSNLERHEEALEAFRTASQLDPSNSDLWLNIGSALSALDMDKDAFEAFDQALHLNPDNANALYNRGSILANQARYIEAERDFRRVTELDPLLPHGWKNYSRVLSVLDQNDLALKSIRTALDLEPMDSEAWTLQGAILGNTGKGKEALASFDKAIQFNPKNPSAWSLRGRVLSNMECFGEALSAFDNAILLGVQTPIIALQRSATLLASSRWEEGLSALGNVIPSMITHQDAFVEATQWILTSLLKDSVSLWQSRAEELLKLYLPHRATSILAFSLFGTIPALANPHLNLAVRRLWFDTWTALILSKEFQDQTKDFELPLRLIDVAIRYMESLDQRIMLELPLEERTLLAPLLESVAQMV